jgi:Ca-activated chloride channel family protein
MRIMKSGAGCHAFIGCVLALLCVGVLSRAHAQIPEDTLTAGTLTFRSRQGEISDALRVHTHVSMAISGVIARVEVRQQFRNPGTGWTEGLYAFPLPENAAVDRLRMEVGERVIVGEIHEKAQAQQLYERARDNGQHASVVHQQRPNLFRTAVANIGPGESITVVISYLQIVSQQEGRYSLRFPLTITPRYVPGIRPMPQISSETPTAVATYAANVDESSVLGDLNPRLANADTGSQSVTFDIDLDAGAPVSEVTSTYHAIETRLRDGHTHVNLHERRIAPDHDFELGWLPIVRDEPVTAVFREHTEAGEHVLVMFMPPHDGTPVTVPREVIFIIDTSGSMSGTAIEQARAALAKGLRDLTSRDRFTVIQFNSTYENLFPAPVPATEQNIATAQRYVDALQATGGTEMYPALDAALGMPTDNESLRQIVFMTDGAVGNEDQLMGLIRNHLGNARLFTVGIGSAPNGHFMRTAAQMGKGTFTYIGSTAEVDSKMSALLDKLTRPVLTHITLDWPRGATIEYAPAQVGDLYAGEPVIVTARFDGEARGVLNIMGQGNGAWGRQILLARTPTRSGVATLWARKRIADLMDSRASGASEDDIRAQVLPLALQYQLVSNYTSLVAIDKTPARTDGEPFDALRVANSKPQGLDWPVDSYPQTATSAELQIAIGIALLLFAFTLKLFVAAKLAKARR